MGCPIKQAFPYLFVDAPCCKIRDDPRFVSKVLPLIANVRQDGYREVLGARIAACETEAFWSGLFGAFSNDGALPRLARVILMDINEEWGTGRRYFSMDDG